MTRYRTSKKSLRIRDVDKTDSGRFTCKGINGFGKEEIKIDLIIIDPVDFPGLPEGALPEVFLLLQSCLNNRKPTSSLQVVPPAGVPARVGGRALPPERLGARVRLQFPLQARRAHRAHARAGAHADPHSITVRGEER